MTCDTPKLKKHRHSFDALKNVTDGAPIERTLQAIAAMSAHIYPHVRCAVLLIEDAQLKVAAANHLLEDDRHILSQVSTQAPHAALASLQRHPNTYVKFLVTPSAELVGALVAFGLYPSDEQKMLDLDLYDVCWMATLAIEQKHLSEELAYRAHHDALTHLWNRVWMEEEIQRVLTVPDPSNNRVGLTIIGIDRFRIINDVLGYQIGNELLCQIAKRIVSRLKSPFSLARGGGDEFMLLMPNLSSPEQMKTVSHSIFECFDKAFEIGNHELVINVSIGTTIVDTATCDSTELQRQAYTALRYAKKRTHGKIVSFHSSMIRVPPERLVMEQHLRFALHKNEFELYYQPQINLSTGRLAGVEALLRWKHPALGFISPAVFIPLAEEIGLIVEIGDWVLDQAIHQCQTWREAGLSDIRMSVNVSALQFARPEFGASIEYKLKTAQIPPNTLELEITESAIMTNFDHALRQMNVLHALGVTLAIDDFGTGHSSLAYLQRLPVQRLKIDRMFVKDATKKVVPPLLASIVQMAHALKLCTVAEGAETTEHLSVLSDLKCEDVQGFIFSKPIPANDLFEWAKKRESTPFAQCSMPCLAI